MRTRRQRAGPRRPESRARPALLAALALLVFAPRADAGRITLDTRTVCSVDSDAVSCEVEVANRGDEAARRVAVSLEAAGALLAADPQSSLGPGANWKHRFELEPLTVALGRSPVVIRVSYEDEGGYPLSTVSHAYLEKGPAPRGTLGASLPSISVRRQPVELTLRIDDPGGGVEPISARLVAPRELTFSGPEAMPTGPPTDGALELRFTIANHTGFAGSSYRVYALLETERDGVRDSLFVPTTLTVLRPELPTERVRAPLLAALVALAAVVGAGLLRRGRTPLPPTDGAGPGRRSAAVLDLAVLVAITAYLLGHLSPALLLAPTTATGGDTASHFLTAKILAEDLLPEGRILGWTQGNLAGYPIFQLYFPLPFLLMAGLSPAVGLQAAFKLVTVLGPVLTPPCAYLAFRCLGFRRPTPALAAVLTVPFLMNESHSVWGGNLPSTLAGEFAYSIGLALALLFVGTAYRGMVEKRWLVGNAALLALVGLSHAYALLIAGALATAHLLWLPGLRRNAWYLGRVYWIAFCGIGFWIVPMLGYSAFTSPYRDVWAIGSWREVLPPILWPLVAVAVVGAALMLRRSPGAPPPDRPRFDPRLAVLANGIWLGFVLYRIAPALGAVDIRFLPLVQLSLALLAAPVLGALARRARPVAATTLVLAGATLLWADSRVTYIPQWAEWNYSGFERRPLWGAFSAVNRYLAGGPEDPRVVFEHTPAHNAAGSIRAFESLPLFSGRSTLEGLYIQSSLNSPQIFYLQSELSEVASCPLPDFHCARLDLTRAAEHLRQFNVGQVVARSAPVQRALGRSREFELEATIPPYEIHRVTGGSGRYVVPLEHEPVLLATDDWKRDFFRWFKRPGASDVVLVHATSRDAGEPSRFRIRLDALPDGVPRRPLAAAGIVVDEEIGQDRIRIRTNRPGHPLLVRVSYHPRWRARGADRVHLASPGFMLVFPDGPEVTLELDDPPLVRLGHLLTLLGCGGALLAGIRRRPRGIDAGSPALSPLRLAGGLAVCAIATFTAWASTGLAQRPFAPALYERGLDLYKQDRFVAAQRLLERAIAVEPLSSAALHSSFYRALCAYRRERWQEAATLFADMSTRFPESPYRAEADYHVGLCRRNLGEREQARDAFRAVVEGFPDSEWSGRAAERLAELS